MDNHVDPVKFGLPPRTILEQIDAHTLAIVINRKSRIIMADGRKIVEKVEKTTRVLKKRGILIFATQDWHPAEHVSFYSNHTGKKPFEAIELEGRTQVLWPPHCVQETANAELLLDRNLFVAVVQTLSPQCFRGGF